MLSLKKSELLSFVCLRAPHPKGQKVRWRSTLMSQTEGPGPTKEVRDAPFVPGCSQHRAVSHSPLPIAGWAHPTVSSCNIALVSSKWSCHLVAGDRCHVSVSSAVCWMKWSSISSFSPAASGFLTSCNNNWYYSKFPFLRSCSWKNVCVQEYVSAGGAERNGWLVKTEGMSELLEFNTCSGNCSDSVRPGEDRIQRGTPSNSIGLY